MYDCTKPSIYRLVWYSHALFILHILTYYDFLRILLFSEIWIVIKKVHVGNTLFV